MPVTNLDKVKELIDAGEYRLVQQMLLGHHPLFMNCSFEEFMYLIGKPKGMLSDSFWHWVSHNKTWILESNWDRLTVEIMLNAEAPIYQVITHGKIEFRNMEDDEFLKKWKARRTLIKICL